MTLRARLILFLGLAILIGANEQGPAGKTLAYFTSTAASASNTISTVTLSMAAPSSSGLFSISSNMIPGDYQLKAIDITNTSCVTGCVPQQDFTYSLADTNQPAPNVCSLLDSSPACGLSNPPAATATTGAALLLFRCTSDALVTTPAACSTSNVYVTQVYPTPGAGLQQFIAAGGLVDAAITGVATAGGSYSIGVGGTSFTGGPVLIGTTFEMGGPNAVTGTTSQTRGIAGSKTDHLASLVYLPSQAGNTLANQTSTLTFTWTAQQRLGGAR